VSLQTIAGNLGESSDTATWVITAFAVANGVTVPLTGWFMRRFGVVTTFTTGRAVHRGFGAVRSGLVAALAGDLPPVAGGCFRPDDPGSQALLMAIFPPEKRGLGLSIWSMTALIGPVMGPILGGYISDNYQWGWIFLINVPIGFLTVGALITKLRPYNTAPMKLPIDVVGLVLLILGRHAAGGAGPWQQSRLVQQFDHRDHGDHLGHRLYRLDHLGADRGKPRGRPLPVQGPQLRAGDDLLHAGLCLLLREQPADAAVAADPAGLHRDMGRAGRRAQRCGLDHDLAAQRAPFEQDRHPLAGQLLAPLASPS
jgi:hypothetical protein